MHIDSLHLYELGGIERVAGSCHVKINANGYIIIQRQNGLDPSLYSLILFGKILRHHCGCYANEGARAMHVDPAAMVL